MYNIERQLLKRVDRRLPPVKNVSLSEWRDIYRDLSGAGDLMARNVFALTGHFICPTNGTRYRAKIDTSSCRLTDAQAVHQICDIDSVIGIMRGDFPLKPGTTLRYFILASPTHTLKSNLHIPKVPLEDPDALREEPEKVALHRLPNARFAEIGEKGIIRAFFPALREETKHQQEPNCVPARHMALLYDRAMLPAAVETLPIEIRRTWPGSYQDEKWRAERLVRNNPDNNPEPTGNHAQQTGRPVHSQYMPAWLEAICARINADPDLAWARGLFFALELRGVKERNVSMHDPPVEPMVDQGKFDGNLLDPFNPRTQAVEGLLSEFLTEQFEPGCWFLDLATTVSVSRQDTGSPLCVFPYAQTHPEMISYLTGIDLAQAEQWVRTKGSCYRRDEVAHLADLAGYAIDIPGPGINGIHDIQVYSTEKSVSYRVDDPAKAKRTSPYSIVTDWKRSRDYHFLPLTEAFCNSSPSHSVAVRIESRISFEQYPYHHHFIPLDTIRPWFLWLSNSTFWGWKVYRLRSIQSTLEQWISARDHFTLDDLPEAGSLVILLCWMANALVNRPDDGSHWDEIRDAGSVHVVRGMVAVPDRPLKAYYLHSLLYGQDGLPRLSSVRTVSIATITYLFSSSNKKMDDLELFALITQPTLPASNKNKPQDPWGIGGASQAPLITVGSHGNKQREVRIENAEEVVDQFAEVIPEPDRVVHYDSEDEDQEERERPTRRSLHLTRIIHNYPIQVFAKVPNRRGHDQSWCILIDDALVDVDFNFFCDADNLTEAFHSYVSFGRDDTKWAKTVKVFFPHLEEAGTLYQGFHTLRVRKQWFRLLSLFPRDRRGEIVKATRQYVNRHWRWLPLMAKNHLWSTGTSNIPRYAKCVGPIPGGPWIVFNSRR